MKTRTIPDFRRAAEWLSEAVSDPVRHRVDRPIVLAINGKPVKGLDDIRAVLKTHPKQVALLIKRDDETLFVPVPLG